MQTTKKILFLSLACFVASTAVASPAEATSGQRELTLDAQARSAVENDEMTVTMNIDAEGPQAQALSQSALATLQRVAAKTKRVAGVEARQGSINTYPVWNAKGKTSTWRLRANLTLKSTDFGKLGQLASELTSEMQISSVMFSLSPGLRAAEGAKLTKEAADAFKSKAASISQALGYASFDIKAVRFNQQILSGGNSPMPMMARAASMGAQEAVPLLAEGGKSDVTVTMSGTVSMN